jgi:hypothetical protein
MSDVRSDLSELAAVDLSDACKLDGSSEWKIRKLIKEKQLESFVDGNRRKVTLRSLKARREWLLQAQNPSPILPPPGNPVKLAKARATKARAKAEARAQMSETDARTHSA